MHMRGNVSVRLQGFTAMQAYSPLLSLLLLLPHLQLQAVASLS